ncbi:MAG TPA: putative Ig domain-containing protein, partial [Terriglobales bacterium]|nr:putative Ig domain-containing protein [Terriglobales bacterium]
TISPTTSTVTSGGSQQFAAFVRGTNQTAVSWSASAGQISSQGLFTAPTVSANALVTVTGTSVADATKHASAQVTVTAVQSSLSITTPSLPAAQLNTPYSATVSATGGKQPYSWSISGSLPSGLQLNASSGSISGSATGSGSFPVSMKVSDSSGQNAQQNFVIIVSSNSQCGPPQYSCSRSDTAVLVPGNPPQLGADPRYYGGHSGAAAIGVDPDYQNRILRVTDGNTDPTRPGMSFNTPASAEKNVTSFDETLFITHDEGNRLCLFQFDPAQFKSTYHGCFYNLGSGGGAEFGYTQADNRAIYNFSGRKLFRFIVDTTSWQVTPDANFNNGTGFVDLDSPTCLNGQITANKWSVHDHAMSSDDGTFIASVGPLQDQDPYFVVWNASKGCQWINVHTWQASRGWDTGQSNPINVVFKSGTVPVPKTSGGGHNAQIDRSGAFGVLAINGEAINHKVFWTIGTNVIDDTCTTCQSHWACDFGICFWDHGSSSNSGFAMSSQPIGSNSITLNMNNAAAATQWPADEHTSHANASPSSRTIYLVAWDRWKQQTTTQVWDSEITGVNWDGSMRTVRFNKHWNSGYGGFWASSRCPISRQGSYALCGSDYQLNNLDRGFGNGLNQDTCDHTLNAGVRGTNACRTDVLLFELR